MERCKFYAQGRCAFGTACRLAHVGPGGSAAPVEEEWQAWHQQSWEAEDAAAAAAEEAAAREADVKEYRKLQKALREIVALEEKQKVGDVLQNNQLRKIEKKEETLLKLSELEQRLEQAPKPEDLPPPPPPPPQAEPSAPSRGPPASRAAIGPPQPVCRHFLSGRCSFGNACRHSHDLEEEPFREAPQAPQRPRSRPEPSFDINDPECGICFESVKSKGDRFGMLEGCDHAFCLKCIRSWRKQRDQQDRLNLRLCPVCRNESFFIVPVDAPILDEEEKRRVITEYKREMGRIPCKLFDYGKGSCAFGSSCFYAHLNPDGTRFVPAPLRWRNGADGSDVMGEVKLSDFLERSLVLP